MSTRINQFLLVVILSICAGCANISSPSGGKKDTKPPKLVSVSPHDSMVNTHVKRLELHFDEYVVLADAQKEVEVSPILQVPPVVTGVNKHIVLKLEDSLLEPNTTYRISFGNAIKDMHEGNAFSGYTYTFSTGSYFDSLKLGGTVINAASGLPDTTGATVMLYGSTENDSAILKKKPRYKAKADGKGAFLFKGLPGKNYRIYAIKDGNNNLTYDGSSEMVAFSDSMVFPADSEMGNISLMLFTEKEDTTVKKDSTTSRKAEKSKIRGKTVNDTNLVYTINIDTSNIKKRTFDLADSIKLVFNRTPILAKNKISITYDSGETTATLPFSIRPNAASPGMVYISSGYWKENTVYTLHFEEGFAIDTGGRKAGHSMYRFKTFNDDDYGKMTLNVPAKYLSGGANSASPDYVLMLCTDKDTLYQRKITDTVIKFARLRPANYTFRIIVDKNKNGKWDTGDLLAKQQPEIVIPRKAGVALKIGWDATIDFEVKPTQSKKSNDNKQPSPKK